MNSPLSDRSRLVLEAANHRAAELRHDYIAAEHLFVALLQTQASALTATLQAVGAAAMPVQRQWGSAHAGVGPPGGRRRSLTNWTHTVLENAGVIAKEFGDAVAEPEHILLALLLEDRGAVTEIIDELGIQREKVQEYLRIRRSP
jgi:ATP-dependent Clp protease ATP-binding subunit ClpA